MPRIEFFIKNIYMAYMRDIFLFLLFPWGIATGSCARPEMRREKRSRKKAECVDGYICKFSKLREIPSTFSI